MIEGSKSNAFKMVRGAVRQSRRRTEIGQFNETGPMDFKDIRNSKEFAESVEFGDGRVTVYSAPEGKKINIEGSLRNSEDFHGDHDVDHVVCFGGTFEGLIGEYDGRFGLWDRDRLPEQEIVVLEYYYDEARQIKDEISQLAARVVSNPSLYDDEEFCKAYFELARAGYRLLGEYEGEFDMEIPDTRVSLERGGLVSTRLALGYSDMSSQVEGEFRVVTKRTHLKDELPTHLAVTVNWRDREQLDTQVAGKQIALCDSVNPASGASTAALILAASVNGTVPSSIDHRSIAATQQGIMFTRRTLGDLGIETSFYTLGIGKTLDRNYYLVGDTVVGDAGHALRQRR